MAHPVDELEGLLLALAELRVQVDELERHLDSAWPDGPPDLAGAAPPEGPDAGVLADG